MATKPTVNNISNVSTSEDLLNQNFEILAVAIAANLSRSDTSSNQMETTLDMNSQKIVNLPAAESGTEPPTLTQVQDLIAAADTGSGGTFAWPTATKTSIVGTDELVIADSADSYDLKKIIVSNILAHTGEVTGTTTLTIADGAVVTDRLADSSVTSAKIGNGEVVRAKIEDTAINTSKIADDAVTTPKIVDRAVDATKLPEFSRGEIMTRRGNGNGDSEVITPASLYNISEVSSGDYIMIWDIGIGALLKATRDQFFTDQDKTNFQNLEDIADSAILGRSSGAGDGRYEELTPAQVATILDKASDQLFIVNLTADETTSAVAATGVWNIRAPYAMEIQDVRVSALTAPTGDYLGVDVLVDVASIFSTKPQIDAGDFSNVTSGTPYVFSNTTVGNDSLISVNIDQVGSTVAGAGVKLIIRAKPTL